jgi:hypothetical protein
MASYCTKVNSQLSCVIVREGSTLRSTHEHRRNPLSYVLPTGSHGTIQAVVAVLAIPLSVLIGRIIGRLAAE